MAKAGIAGRIHSHRARLRRLCAAPADKRLLYWIGDKLIDLRHPVSIVVLAVTGLFAYWSFQLSLVTSFEPTAVAFTEAPTSVAHLARQRRRWARGMIEGLRTYGVALLRRHAPYAHSVAANVIFPYLDVAFTFAFLPGIVLALTGNFAIVGPMTLAVLPLNLLLAAIMYRRQRTSLHEAGLHVRRHLLGFLGYVFLYQLLMSPVSVAGYTQELLHLGRRW